MKSPRFTFQFFTMDKHITTLWLDELIYDKEENVFVVVRENSPKYFLPRENITHFRRSKGKR